MWVELFLTAILRYAPFFPACASCDLFLFFPIELFERVLCMILQFIYNITKIARIKNASFHLLIRHSFVFISITIKNLINKEISCIVEY